MDPHVWCKIVYIRIRKIGDIYLYWIALIWLFQPNNYRNCIQTHSYMMEPSGWIYRYLCVRIEVDCGPMKIAFSIQIAVWMADEFRVLLKSHRRTHTHTSTQITSTSCQIGRLCVINRNGMENVFFIILFHSKNNYILSRIPRYFYSLPCELLA